MFLVAGLGNPGEEYANTPHNLGFMVVDRLAEMHQHPRHQARFQGADGSGADRRPRGDAGQAPDIYESQRHVAEAADGEAFAHGRGPDSGLRRIGPAVDQFAHQAARLVRRPQRSRLRDPQPGHDGFYAGAVGDSSRPSARAAGRIICCRRSSARRGRNWSNWWPMGPTRLSP